MATIKDVFDAVQAGAADLGVVPFENSTHGVVTFTLADLADRTGAYADLSVCSEIYLDVHHFLLGYKQPTPPQQEQPPSSPTATTEPLAHAGTFGPTAATPTTAKGKQKRPPARPAVPLTHVQRVLSHPQAFGQTTVFMAAHLRGVECVDVSSTSKAAEMAAADASGATAAIAGEIAASQFGLDVLARWIEDRDDNTTRFFVLQRGGGQEDEEGGGREKEGGVVAGKGKGHKSLMSFTVPHHEPGALACVLDAFRKYGLSLTSINSLPSLVQPFSYLFFVEFEGSRHYDPEGRVKSALEDVDRVAESWRWLGSWENAR